MEKDIHEIFKFDDTDTDLKDNLIAFIEYCSSEKLINKHFLDKCATIPTIAQDDTLSSIDAISKDGFLKYRKYPNTIDQRVLLYHELAQYIFGMTKSAESQNGILNFCHNHIIGGNIDNAAQAKRFCRGIIAIDRDLCDEFAIRSSYASLGLSIPELRAYKMPNFGERIIKSNFKSKYKPLQEPVSAMIAKSDLKNIKQAFASGVDEELFEELSTSFKRTKFINLISNFGKLMDIIENKDGIDYSKEMVQIANNNQLYSNILYQINDLDRESIIT